ncbi:oxygen tolerance protein BatD [Luteimonas cucumeris]|uniref:Oxygen tolerance protein BatD n=1 Tax=Luteimonas cucumeris TaxID=985012 RepID=A0A562LF22_9GAMM|nr:BatD family protein [Luteimonas cucumeris]TWI06214.1 oxygen tolerance protein BatD [Luteimonas cucumeris]
MSRSVARIIILLSLLLPAFALQAQTRAWLDRDQIALGETATLNIETDQSGTDAPDYSALLRDFELSGHTSSRQFVMENGQSRSRVLYAVALEPRREGALEIPALEVGTQRTQPLTLTVTPAAAAPARTGGQVFIEVEVDDEEPYVQQAVGLVMRLYYAVPLLSGQLELDTPEGASMQRVGEDLQYAREIDGRRYNVVERRMLLIPERSGTLNIPAARFRGRGAGGFFDDMLGDGQRELRASSAPRFLKVLPVPTNAPQPWLPLRDLRLRYIATPQQARAGEAATVVIEATADGATAAQMPELQLSGSDGAQVFAEPVQSDESFVDGRPQVKLTRRFSIVPARDGKLTLQGPRLGWWDVRADAAKTATLPPLALQVAPGSGNTRAPVAPTTAAQPENTQRWIRIPGVQHGVGVWAVTTVVFALLWLLTLAWGLHRRHGAVATSAPMKATTVAAGGQSLSDLKRVLDAGDLADITDTLCTMATPPVTDLDALLQRLDDGAQRDAVEQLRRARWGGGDAVAARAALRDAFKAGPSWRQSGVAKESPLPPLYPGRGAA